MLQEDPSLNIHDLDIPVNAVATALKGFFADLADPLIPCHTTDELLKVYGEFTIYR